jgi:tetratricopeptide (TPR) repeat protein
MGIPPAAARTAGIAGGLVLLTLVVFAQVGRHDFVDFDDGEYVYDNPRVRAGLSLEGARWAFTTAHAANWHPLTWLSHMADVQAFGLDPGWHHRVSVALHAVNAVLLFLVLGGMTGAVWPSAWVAGLFAVHPLHVESVAWIAERKDVLSAFFWFLTLGLYWRWVRRPGPGSYAAALLALALGLLSKPMLVTVPFVLLLLDYWPLRRLVRQGPGGAAGVAWERVPRLLLEKGPLFALAAGSAAATAAAQSSWGATASVEAFPLAARVANAVVSYVVYLARAVWPSSLAVFYPHPASLQERLPAWQVWGAALALGTLTLLALRSARRQPYVAVGWLWFVGTLLPVIGIVQVGSQAMADRYTYVPLIGIFVAVAWAAPDLLRGWRYGRHLLAALGGAILVALSLAAWTQTGYWRDNASLYSRAIAVTPNNWLAWNNLGHHHLRRGALPEARSAFQEALRIKPDYADAWYNAGVVFARSHDHPRAIAAYREALRLDPANADGWANLGLVQQSTGQDLQAIASYREALRLRPHDPVALTNLVVVYARTGDATRARETYRRLLAVDPARAAELLRALGASR